MSMKQELPPSEGESVSPGDVFEAMPLEQRVAEQLLEQAKADGVKLVGPGGLLAGVTRRILESALETEMAEHLGYDKGDPAGRGAERA